MNASSRSPARRDSAPGARMSLLLEAGAAPRRGRGPPPRPAARASPPRRCGPPRSPAGPGAARTGSSASSRAASTACTVSGSSTDAVALLLGQAAHHLLGEQRVAAGALGHLRRELAAAVVPPSRLATSSARVVGRERVEEDLGRAAPPAAPAGRGARAARRGPGRAASAGRAPTGRGARSRRACRRRPSGCPRRPAPAAAASAAASITERSAEKNASRIRSGSARSAGTCSGGTSRPSERAICAAWRSGGSSPASTLVT